MKTYTQEETSSAHRQNIKNNRSETTRSVVYYRSDFSCIGLLRRSVPLATLLEANGRKSKDFLFVLFFKYFAQDSPGDHQGNVKPENCC